MCFSHWLSLEFSPDILSGIPVPDQWHTHKHTHKKTSHSTNRLMYSLGRYTQRRFKSHTDVRTPPVCPRLWRDTKEGSRERRLIRKPRSLAQGYHGYTDVVRVCLCVHCMCEDGGRRKWDSAGEVRKKMERAKRGAWPGKKIEGTVVSVKQNTHKHKGSKGRCFVYQAVTFLLGLCWVQWSSSRYLLSLTSYCKSRSFSSSSEKNNIM